MKKSLFFAAALVFFCVSPPVSASQPPASEAARFAELNALNASSFWPALEIAAGDFLHAFPHSSFTPRVTLMRGAALFHLADYDAAVSLLLPVFASAQGAEKAAAAYWLGLSYGEAGKYAESLPYLYEAAQFFPAGSAEYLAALLCASRSLVKTGNEAKAVPVLEYLAAVPETGAGFFEAVALLFAAYETLNRDSDILSLYAKIDITSFPAAQAEQIAYICAFAYAAGGEYDRSLAVLERLVPVLPHTENLAVLQDEFLLRLAVRSFNQKEYKTALEYFTRVGAGSAAPVRAVYEAQIAFAQNADAAAALSSLSKILPVAGMYRPWVLAESARYAIAAGRFAEALSFADEARAAFPAGAGDLQASCTYLKLRALYGLGDYVTLVSLVATAVNPDAASLRLYALSLAALNQETAAAAVFESVYEKTALAADALDLSRAYLRAGKNAAAFRLASTLTGEPAALVAGLAAVNLQNWTEAERLLAAVKSGEKVSFARYYEAYAAYRLEKYARACDAFAAFVKENPASPLYWKAARYGTLAAVQISRLPQAAVLAETAWKAAIRFDEKVESALLLAGIYADAGKTAQAIALLTPLSRGDTSGSWQCLFALAGIYAADGQIAAADEAWLAVAQKSFPSPLAQDAAFRRAELFYGLKDWEQASTRFASYRKTYPAGRYADAVLYMDGASLYHAGRADEAILLWQELALKYPDGSYAYNTLAQLSAAYRQRGEYRQAAACLEKLLAKYPSQAREAGFEKNLAEVRLLADGADEKQAAAIASYERAGKLSSPAGRALAPEVAAYYLSRPEKRSEGITLLAAVLEKTPVESERLTAAKAAYLLGNAYREQGDYPRAAATLLTAAEHYAPLDAELTARSLYGAAESFDRAGSLAELRSVYETMRAQMPVSVWTKRAAALLGGTN